MGDDFMPMTASSYLNVQLSRHLDEWVALRPGHGLRPRLRRKTKESALAAASELLGGEGGGVLRLLNATGKVCEEARISPRGTIIERRSYAPSKDELPPLTSSGTGRSGPSEAIQALTIIGLVLRCWICSGRSKLRHPIAAGRSRLSGKPRPRCKCEYIAEGDLALFLDDSSLARRWGYLTPTEIEEEEEARRLWGDVAFSVGLGETVQPIEEALRILRSACADALRRAKPIR